MELDIMAVTGLKTDFNYWWERNHKRHGLEAKDRMVFLKGWSHAFSECQDYLLKDTGPIGSFQNPIVEDLTIGGEDVRIDS